ncbi:NDT80 / phoG like DNA-binding family domain-containing protein [Hirsutella rhossiliensis]|uniref:NDT80 / phoG like DNA-binding family domain-containing protein n=1 Tax=Hirsutella rhossiliensis TaxID=111463 RepID=A0A9P8SEW5_9HYPO|nr:NDT80 / phoG like DNA-binding family domain-containing protein [Hirsutella rhossiliensis]KAH0958805.1 NDT80 / phoG like DNA-binding family domain-containing protein [Hirsutella rhossiliensis]
MATFNSMPAMTAAAASETMAMANGSSQHMAMEHFDHALNFDEALLDGGALAPLPFTPAYDFESFATTFEDPFSYSARAFEPTPNPDPLHEPSSPQELDNKLLGFSDPIRNFNVVNDAGNIADLHLSAELYGMFFVAEDVFGGDSTGRPLELTCYRRNLWQCSGQITLPRTVSHLIDEQGRQFPTFELSASISALESIEGKATEIISIPWKSSNPPPNEESKVAAAPPYIPLDLGTAPELDATRVSVPVSWKRLQFKHATANNGRRKGLQQNYVVQINLLGKVKSGETVKIAEIQSGPVIVRGRSPRNFDSRRDVHLTGEKRMERKNTVGPDGTTIKTERESLQAPTQRLQGPGNVSTPTAEWASHQAVPQPSQSPRPAKRMAVSPNVARPPVPPWSADTNPGANRHSTAVPINLSLSEDEKSPNRSSAELQSPQLGKALPAAGQNTGNSPADDPDPLYEYFPLTVDDWMPPVDAVYRPHVVHHTIVPPEIKAQQVRSKTKRYFAAE